jgi:hypothetical protein
VSLLVAGCTTAVAGPTPTVVGPTATPVAPPAPTVTRPSATSTPLATNLKTFHIGISFATYETEETVQLQLGHLPGVASVNVTQLDVTVQYDAARLSEDEILRTLRDNPEVRIKDDSRAGN